MLWAWGSALLNHKVVGRVEFEPAAPALLNQLEVTIKIPLRLENLKPGRLSSVNSFWTIAMTVRESLGVLLLFYLGWAVFQPEGHFHLVWSLALLVLLILVSLLQYQSFSTPTTIILCLLTLLDFVVCIGLSPLRRILYSSAEEIPHDQDCIHEFSSPGSDTASPPHVCEFVYPILCLEMRVLTMLRLPK